MHSETQYNGQQERTTDASKTTAEASKTALMTKDTNATQVQPSSTSKTFVSNVPPRPKQEILEEDDYTAALSKIIERDFFPDLAKLKRQHAYLEAVEMGDLDRIRATALELTGKDTPATQRRLQTPAHTPRYAAAGVPDQEWTPARVDVGKATPSWKDLKAGRDTDDLADRDPRRPGGPNDETPMLDTPYGATSSRTKRRRTNPDDDGDAKGNQIDTSLSLDQFQARYTSEDNASFNQIIENANRERQAKYQWMYDRETKSMRVQYGDSKTGAGETTSTKGQKLITQGEGHANKEVEASSAKALVVAAPKDGNSEDDANAGNGAEKMAEMLRDKRPVAVPTWEYKAKNTLMYYPEGLGTTLIQDDLLRGRPKEIVHRNTGFQGQDLLVINQTAAAKIDAVTSRDGADGETPSVNGYKFVSSTPSPAMSQLGDDPELLTWGTIEDEPLLISSGVASSAPSNFRLPPTPRRELIAQKLTEKASKSFREKTNLRAQVFASPSSSSTPLAKYHQDHFGSTSTPTPSFQSPRGVTSSSTPFRTPSLPASKLAAARISSPNPRMRAEELSPAAKRLLERASNSRSGQSSLSNLSSSRSTSSSSSSASRGGNLGSVDHQLRSHYSSPLIRNRQP
ncbi:DiGeorge syndrome critical region protein 14 [Actinomortierella wolfii]|nr:DiGeorge syndrome critical region protein 14 [Actinomortierella wolfii]